MDYSSENQYPPLIIYNRVPKTGSTTFANIAYKLTGANNFHMLHLNVTYKNMHYLTILDQQRFVRNISLWKEKTPALYHGHLYFLEFTRFGFPNPIYINIVRDPIERLVSYYYFLRYGDDYRPKLKRASAKDNKTLDECLLTKGKDCDLERVMWVQIPFFCGHSVECLKPGRWALEQAKTNLLNKYLLVGVTEHLEQFIAMLEVMLPRYFSGAYDLFKTTNLGYLRKTKEKHPPSEQTVAYIRSSKVYQLEQEFYEFAKAHFRFLVARTHTKDEEDRIVVNGPIFKYEKIFPRRS
ncbi:heparan sulfate 2-O-sulfotransferase 1-like isoform X2 [Watersipora subatra]